MHYCGVNCQRSDWEIHKFECKKFQTTENLSKNTRHIGDDELVRLFIRLIIKVQVKMKLNKLT